MLGCAVYDNHMTDGVLKYGGLGNFDATNAPNGAANFAGSGYNGLSFCCTPIELLANDGSDKVVGTATGFFWRKDDKHYLVTNWHVVSGRNSFTLLLNPKAYVPKCFCFYGLSVSVQSGMVHFIRQRWTIEFTGDMDAVLAKPPQVDGQPIDIWGFPIADNSVFGRDPSRTGFEGGPEASCLLNDHSGQRIVTNVGDDCFILGYPLRNYDGFMPPIWKRGSIASETPLGLDGRPIFLVDAATTPGMSGSPIIRKVVTLTADNKDIGAIKEYSHYEMIGVYAGRLESLDLAAVNLGYGWYRSVIDRALDHYPWSPTNVVMESTE